MIFAVEKRILDAVHKYLWVLVLLLSTLFGFAIRYVLRDYISNDMGSFLLPWYETIKSKGGILSLNEQVGDYNMFYQLLISLMSYLPFNPIHLYKMLSCVFDFLLAGTCAVLVYKFSRNTWSAVSMYVGVLFLPTTFLNSAAWGQCDSIYTVFIVISLVALLKDRMVIVFVALGLAFTFKLQAIFVLPFYLFLYFQKKNFSLVHFGIIPLVMCVMSIPNIIMGRNFGEIFTLYTEQTDIYHALYLNYPSFWALFRTGDFFEPYSTFRNVALIFTIVVLAAVMIYWVQEKMELTSHNMLYMAFLIMYTCVLFLPSMHERYSYPYEIFALIIMCINPKGIVLPALVLFSLSLNTYGHFLFNTPNNLPVLAVLNLLVYSAFMYVLTKRMKKA